MNSSSEGVADGIRELGLLLDGDIELILVPLLFNEVLVNISTVDCSKGGDQMINVQMI